MTGLILLAAVQVGLVVCLIFLVSKFTSLVRSGAPLIRLSNPFRREPAQKNTPSGASPRGGPDTKTLRMVSFNLPLPRKHTDHAVGSKAQVLELTEARPQRTRSRRLLTLSELESASNRAAAQFPENYYVEIEGRLEELFHAYLGSEITLAEYLDRARKERALTHAVLRNGQVLIDPQLRQEAERAAAAIDWCLDWASGQMPTLGDELAA